MKKLLGHINVVNLLLVAALVFSLNYNFGPPVPAQVIKPNAAQKANGLFQNSQGGFTNDAAADPLVSYAIIAEQNLFNPERKIPVPKVVLPPPPKPELVLHGTLIMGDRSVAYISEKNNAPGFAGAPQAQRLPYRRGPQPLYSGPQRQPSGAADKAKAYKKGDSIDGFILTSIEPDRVLLVRGNESMEVFLSQPVTDLQGMNAPAQRGFAPRPYR